MHFAPLFTTLITIIEVALLKCKNILVTDEKKASIFGSLSLFGFRSGRGR